MALEQWNDTIKDGDVLSRKILLHEIKTNLANILQDYAGRGVENEAALIADVNTLFTGEIIPSRRDWDILVTVLRVLSTEKEQGVMYQNFIQDVSDSLGVTDLEKIKNFIDYIQGLAPLMASLEVVLPEPERYYLTPPKDTTTDQWDHATLTWSLSSNYLKKPTATIKIKDSLSEDVTSYEINIVSGSFSRTITVPANNIVDTSIVLDWTNWFPANQLKQTYFNVELVTIDKRGNRSATSVSKKYANTVFIPQGVKQYELQYQIDNSSFKTIATTTATTIKWDVPKVNGTYRYRVRALDKSGFYHGGLEGSTYTDWSWGNPRYIRFIPDKPDKPNPKVSVDWKEAIVTWAAVPRAEFYEIWHGAEKWAKDNTKGGNTYWKRIKSTDKREIKLGRYNEGKAYTFYVRALNEGGQNTGSVNATIKRRPLKKASYGTADVKVWRAGYDYKSQWGYITKNKADWRRDSSNIYQGEWKEPDWGGASWAKRGGGTYWAHKFQAWGNNMSFIFLDYGKMRKELKGKSIQKVTIQLSRASGTAALNAHGYKQATPLYLYNHNRDQSWSTTAANAFSLFRADRKRVGRNNQQVAANAIFDRGETEKISNNITKQLIKNIVDGHMRGLGIVKYYGNNFGDHGPTADTAYMILNKKVTVIVEYYD